jgi:hypothetical protein
MSLWLGFDLDRVDDSFRRNLAVAGGIGYRRDCAP